MSHFLTYVIFRDDQSYDELLAPYSENLEVEPYVQYTREEAIAYAKKHYDPKGKTDEECWKMVAQDYDHADDNGNIFSTYNPNSKWDWYYEGGRFGTLECKAKDFSFEYDQDEYDYWARFWEVVVEHDPLKPGEVAGNFTAFCSPSYLQERFGTKENYATYQSAHVPYAVVTPDGQWYSQGTMGWFGISVDDMDSNEWIDMVRQLIKNADPEDNIIAIDCHI